MKRILILILCFQVGFAFSQEEDDDRKKAIAEAERYVATGNQSLVRDANFPKAEGEYRKAIAKNPVDPTAKYNLANAYYDSKKYDEATQRYAETVKIASSKEEKHKALHNQGNTFMEQKKYKEAVEAYKSALRNNSKDDETRFNLAYAKKKLEQEQKEQEENKDKKKDQDKDQNKDDKDKEGDNKEDKKDKEGEDKEDKKDKKDEGDKGEDKKDKEGEDKKEDKGDEKKDEEGKPKDEEQGKDGDKKEDKGKPEGEQPQQMQGQLSPQQVKSLLEAMNNEEKKVQDKMNAKKVQGAKIRTEKDW